MGPHVVFTIQSHKLSILVSAFKFDNHTCWYDEFVSVNVFLEPLTFMVPPDLCSNTENSVASLAAFRRTQRNKHDLHITLSQSVGLWPNDLLQHQLDACNSQKTASVPPFSCHSVILWLSTRQHARSETFALTYRPRSSELISVFLDFTADYTDESFIRDSMGYASIYDGQFVTCRLYSLNSVYVPEKYAIYRLLLFSSRQNWRCHLLLNFKFDFTRAHRR